MRALKIILIALILANLIVLGNLFMRRLTAAPTREPSPFPYPPPTATPEEQGQYAEKVKAMAMQAPFLDISGCTPRPVVLAIRTGEQIIITNNDLQPHTILFEDRLYRYVIGAQSSLAISANFALAQPQGIYPYFCDDPSRYVGIFSASKPSL